MEEWIRQRNIVKEGIIIFVVYFDVALANVAKTSMSSTSKVFVPDKIYVWLAGEVIGVDENNIVVVRIEDDVLQNAEIRRVDTKK